ncbi:hypothetical protein BgiBS90_027397, partial [Biomphalaria glabrata]
STHLMLSIPARSAAACFIRGVVLIDGEDLNIDDGSSDELLRVNTEAEMSNSDVESGDRTKEQQKHRSLPCRRKGVYIGLSSIVYQC